MSKYDEHGRCRHVVRVGTGSGSGLRCPNAACGDRHHLCLLHLEASASEGWSHCNDMVDTIDGLRDDLACTVGQLQDAAEDARQGVAPDANGIPVRRDLCDLFDCPLTRGEVLYASEEAKQAAEGREAVAVLREEVRLLRTELQTQGVPKEGLPEAPFTPVYSGTYALCRFVPGFDPVDDEEYGCYERWTPVEEPWVMESRRDPRQVAAQEDMRAAMVLECHFCNGERAGCGTLEDFPAAGPVDKA